MSKENKMRQIVVPGEVIAEGDKLPGDSTIKQNDKIVALRYGTVEEVGKVVRVVPISGVYSPRPGNIIIGVVSDLTFNGWLIDIDFMSPGFLGIADYPRYVNKGELEEHLRVGDVVVCKIAAARGKNIDLTLKGRGLSKLNDGMLMKVNPSKVPRIIGKAGSMITSIKDRTYCRIIAGQNGLIWIRGDNIDDEILTKQAIEFVSDNALINGLTDKVAEWLNEKTKGRPKKERKEFEDEEEIE